MIEAPDDDTTGRSPGPSDGKLHLLGASVVAVIILWLHPAPFFRPELWAEDGAEWLAGALRDGPLSCLRPVASTFVILPRLIASLAVLLLPLEAAPAAFSWTSLLVAATVLGSVVRREMAWIHPDYRWRLGISVGLAVMPALAEVSMALCNGSYMFGLAGLLLSLRDRPRFSWLSAAVLALLMLSSTIGMLVPAVWAWRALSEPEDRQTSVRFLAVSLLALGLMALAAFFPLHAESGLVYSSTPPAMNRPAFEPLTLLEIFTSRLIILGVGLPLFGLSTTSGLMRSGPDFWLLLVPLAFMLRTLWKVHPRLVIGLCLGALIFPLMHLGRNYGPYLSLEIGQPFPFARWSLVGEAFALMGFGALLGRGPKQLHWFLLVPLTQFLWCSSLPNQVSSSWDTAPALDFGPTAREIETQRAALEAGTPGEVLTPVIPVHPHGWATFQIKLQ